MMRMKYLAAAAIILALTACSSNKNTDLKNTPPATLYANAQEKLQKGDYRNAIQDLEALDNRYPFGPYSQQAQLDLIYAYYKAGDVPLAQASIDRFLRLNPTHPNVDYVLYLRGITNMAADESIVQNFFGVERYDRDPHASQVAFNDFNQLLRNHPDSKYAADAKQRMISLKNQLARHDLSIAEFYTKRGAYVAVINRVEQMLRYYPDTQATLQALPLMKNAYQQLKMAEQANKVQKIVDANKA